uniref:Uncharacterized protein n=1 Tax=Rhizophora mucronata TaxID=61149 RepID=A0A2P2QEM5_RHIMU
MFAQLLYCLGNWLRLGIEIESLGYNSIPMKFA